MGVEVARTNIPGMTGVDTEVGRHARRCSTIDVIRAHWWRMRHLDRASSALVPTQLHGHGVTGEDVAL
jgi:hypothetical protein